MIAAFRIQARPYDDYSQFEEGLNTIAALAMQEEITERKFKVPQIHLKEDGSMEKVPVQYQQEIFYINSYIHFLLVWILWEFQVNDIAYDERVDIIASRMQYFSSLDRNVINNAVRAKFTMLLNKHGDPIALFDANKHLSVSTLNGTVTFNLDTLSLAQRLANGDIP